MRAQNPHVDPAFTEAAISPLENAAPEALSALERGLGQHIPHLHVLFETSPDCLKLIDGQGKLLSMNINGCQLMEIEDFGPLRGQDWMSFWPDPKVIQHALEEARQTGFSKFQAFCPTARGTPKWWDVQVIRVKGTQHGAVSFLSSSRDITHLKKTEADLLEARKSLAERVEELERTQSVLELRNEELGLANAKLNDLANIRKEELIASNAALLEEIKQRKQAEHDLTDYTRQLERTNGDLQDIAYITSHDLQEPLRMVTSYVQLLQKRYGDALDDDAHEFIRYAVDGTRRMKALLDDLLSYARVSATPDVLEPVSVSALLDDLTKELKASLQVHGAKLYSEDLPVVQGNPTQLSSLLRNLIDNALKYRSDTPPEIHISAKEGEADNQDMWTFAIKDNGIGIDEAVQERIFALFTRLNAREDYPGNGVGLAICRRIVENHKGQIWVESEDAGSTFYFTLPR